MKRSESYPYTLCIVDGNLHSIPGAQLAFVADESAGPHHALTDSDIFQPGPSLTDVDAMARFVQRMCPHGWTVVDGEIVALEKVTFTLGDLARS